MTIVATMLLAAIFFTADNAIRDAAMLLPLAIGGVCILTSIVGTYFVKLRADNNIMGALYRGLLVTGGLSLVGIVLVTTATVGLRSPLTMSDDYVTNGFRLILCSVIGLAVTGAIVWITEYYTSTEYRPVRSIAQSSTTGHGTQRDPGSGDFDGSHRPAGGGDFDRYHRVLQPGASVRHRHRRHYDAGPGRHDRGAGCLRSPSRTTPAASPRWPTCRRTCARPPICWMP